RQEGAHGRGDLGVTPFASSVGKSARAKRALAFGPRKLDARRTASEVTRAIALPGGSLMSLRPIGAFAALFAASFGAAVADDSSTAVLQKLQDKAEIEALVAKYVFTLDPLDADGYASVFAEDAVYEVTGTRYEGRAAIRKIVTDLSASRARNEAAGTPSP